MNLIFSAWLVKILTNISNLCFRANEADLQRLLTCVDIVKHWSRVTERDIHNFLALNSRKGEEIHRDHTGDKIFTVRRLIFGGGKTFTHPQKLNVLKRLCHG